MSQRPHFESRPLARCWRAVLILLSPPLLLLLQYPELLDDPPHGRNEPLITGLMYMHMLAAATYKLFWLFACLYGLPRVLDRYA